MVLQPLEQGQQGRQLGLLLLRQDQHLPRPWGQGGDPGDGDGRAVGGGWLQQLAPHADEPRLGGRLGALLVIFGGTVPAAVPGGALVAGALALVGGGLLLALVAAVPRLSVRLAGIPRLTAVRLGRLRRGLGHRLNGGGSGSPRGLDAGHRVPLLHRDDDGAGQAAADGDLLHIGQALEHLVGDLELVHAEQVIPRLDAGGLDDLLLGIAAVARHGHRLHLEEHGGPHGQRHRHRSGAQQLEQRAQPPLAPFPFAFVSW